jgi:ppGpp synthetase/RelA/SpoT-type nucleotidyltranferase
LILIKSLREAENQNVEEKELISNLKSQHNYPKFFIKRVTRRVKVCASKKEKKERKLR